MAGQAIVTIQGREWLTDLAVAPWELTQGLGGIPGIPAGTGMLFDMSYEQSIDVTTEPMLFPLDIAFLSEDLAVTEVYRNVEPGYLVNSVSPARYFLEVNAGEFELLEPGDAVIVDPLPPQDVPAAPSWVTLVYGVAGMLLMGAIVAALVKGIAAKQSEPEKKPAFLPHTTPARKPTRAGVSVHSWEERDRLGIWITDTRSDRVLAEWWDDDARQLFEDGFFKPGTTRNQEISGKAFEDSVLGYAEHIGILTSAVSPAVQPLPSDGGPVAALAEKWSRAKRNSALALKDLEAISSRYDISECKEALLEYRDLDRSDYSDAEEYQEARDEAWEAFVECLESLSAEEEEEQEEKEKDTFRCSVCGKGMNPVDAMMGKVCGACTREQHRRAVKGLPPLPEKYASTRPMTHKTGGGLKPSLDYLADSPELLAWTIEDIGYRDRIDSAFTQAIARARGER